MTNTPANQSIDEIIASAIRNRDRVDAVQSIKRLITEARVEELERIEIGGDNIWTVDKGEDMAMLISERIKELREGK
jgi:hypothetical protein